MNKFLRVLLLKGWILLIGILLGFLISFFLIINSPKNEHLFLSIYILGVLFLIIILGSAGLVIANLILKSYSLRKAKKFQNRKNSDVAVILGNDTWQGFFVSTYLGIKYLFKYLKLKNKQFNVYIMPSKEEFNGILKNSRIDTIYLIGHGSSRGFELNKKETIYYSDYKNSKIAKRRINLYHCGHGDGKTLIDYLVKKENKEKCHRHYDKERVIFYVSNFYNLYKNEKKKQSSQKLKTQGSKNK